MIPSVALNREILLKLGEQLRALDDINDAVSDQFVELLARIEIGHKHACVHRQDRIGEPG